MSTLTFSAAVTANKPVEASRKNNFDFLRFVFAFFVIVSHSFGLLKGDTSTDPLMRITGGQLTFGNVAVDFFFVISGFLITQSWLRSKSPISYAQRRIRRIYPGFLVANLVGLFIVGTLVSSDASAYLHQIKPGRLLLQLIFGRFYEISGPFAHNPLHPDYVNASLWTIGFEVCCYVLVAVIGLAQLYRRPAAILTLFCGALLAYWYQEITGHYFDYGIKLRFYFGDSIHWARLLSFFLSGMLLYLYRDRIPMSDRVAALLACLLVIATLVHHLSLALPICGSYLVIFLAFTPRLKMHNFAQNGDKSYGLYLWAFPIQQSLIFAFGRYLSPLVLLGLSGSLTYLAALASWRYIEKPFLYERARAFA